MMQEEQDILIIYQFLNGKLSREEGDRLRARLDSDNELQALYIDLEKIHQNGQTEPTSEVAFNLPLALERFQHSTGISTSDVPDQVAKPARSLRRILWMSASVAAVAMLLFGFFFVMNNPVFAPLQVAETGEETMTIELPDGSAVTLNSHSTLKYPEKFSSKQRKVFLTGTASFEVTKDESKPFRVETDEVYAEVLGTVFVLETDDEISNLFVLEGKVRLNPVGSKKYIDLLAGTHGSYHHRKSILQKHGNRDFNQVAWYTKTLKFDNTPMPQVWDDLESYYKVKFDLETSDIEKCRFVMTRPFKDARIEDILNAIQITFRAEIVSLDSTSFRVRGGICK